MTAALDFSYARPSGAEIIGAGAQHALAYTGSGKPRPTQQYIESLLAAGVTFTFIQESYANRAQEGFSAGVQDAQYADSQADGVGYPDDAAIAYCASDGSRQVPGPGAAGSIANYGRGVASASKRPLLAYGNRMAVDAFRSGAGPKCVGTWVPATWDAVPFLDVLVQEPNIPSPVQDTDWNTVYGSWPCWGSPGGDEDLNDDQNKWLQALYQWGGGDANLGKVNNLFDVIAGKSGPYYIANVSILEDIAKLSDKIDKLAQGGGSTPIDYAALAKAVNDDAAKRMQQ